MVLTSDNVPTGSEDKRPVSIPSGVAGGKLSSRRSRVVVEQVCGALGILRKDVTVPVLEACVEIVEKALLEAQGRAVRKDPAGKRAVNEGDEVDGKPCAACRGKLQPGQYAVPARPKDGNQAEVSWVHAACAIEAADNA